MKERKKQAREDIRLLITNWGRKLQTEKEGRKKKRTSTSFKWAGTWERGKRNTVGKYGQVRPQPRSGQVRSVQYGVCGRGRDEKEKKRSTANVSESSKRAPGGLEHVKAKQ